MTAEQLLTRNKITLEDRDKINFVATLEMRLMKHLISQEDARVRAYMIVIRILWPTMSEMPISLKLLKKASAFLESRGWHMNLTEDHSERVGRYITRTRAS
jgi:hypothetical protein